MKRRIIIALLLLSASIGFGPLTERGASARRAVPNPVVTNLNDSGAGSLRQAISDADAGGTITFQAGLTGAITLASQLTIDKELTIQGPGANLLTISGNNAVRVFNITAGDVTLTGLTIANGQATDTFIWGGGINYTSAGTLTLQQCTLSGNSANIGGGICNNGGTVIVNNSTLSGNSAGGFGGGIFNADTVKVRNTIIAGNTAGSMGPDVHGVFTSRGHNLIGKNNNSTGFPAGNPNANQDIVGTSGSPIDPLLGPLADNGGPTKTRALLLCSPAINAGDNCVAQNPGCLATPLTTDQRGPGFQRNFGGTVDIGAFESLESQESCNTPPTITGATISWQQGAAGTVETIANVGDGQDAPGSLSVTVTSVPANITITGLTNTNGAITATVAASNGPVITLKPAITLWTPNHTYQTITMAQMLQSATGDCGGDLSGAVVIEKVTSDELDNVKGASDGETINDIVIVDCQTVKLRAERDEKKNGRVYLITLRVKDTASVTTRKDFKVSVPIGQNGVAAVQDGVALTKTRSCP
jgi:hypothetical protein